MMEADIPAEGGNVGRLKKNNVMTCPHSDCSGLHATIYPDGVEDYSTNGTFIVYNRLRSGFVPVPAGTGVKVGDVEMLLK